MLVSHLLESRGLGHPQGHILCPEQFGIAFFKYGELCIFSA